MRHSENCTCIIFIERNAIEHKDSIRFTEDNSRCICCSKGGKVGGAQDIIVGRCALGIIIHELGHAIGFYHEHRDEYIEILREMELYRKLITLDEY